MGKLMVAVMRFLPLCAGLLRNQTVKPLIAFAIGVILSVGIHSPAAFAAIPIAQPGTEGLEVIVNSTNPVIATYQGNNSATFSNDLYLVVDGNPANDRFLFNNHASPVGSKVNLGSFPVGTKLVFRLHVRNTGRYYFTGPASRNPDNKPHARAQANWMPNETLVSFEDNVDFAYNDLSFSFIPTTAVGRSAGWHSNNGRNSLISEVILNGSRARILLGNMYVYESPVADPLYWYVQIIYVNLSLTAQLPINCVGRADPALVKEHMQGTPNAGWVPAEETFCSRNPNFSGFIEPGGMHYEWAIFHNVPWPGKDSIVRIEWGPYGFSDWFEPWDRPYPNHVPPPAECPPELVRFGKCREDRTQQPMRVHLSRTPEGKAPHLVVLVHGCCTTPDAYVREWYQVRGDELISAITLENLKQKDKARAWEIVIFDWTNFTPVPPIWDIKNFLDQANIAYDAASDKPGQPGQGTRLAGQVEKYPYYKYVHLIAHSAGSNLIDTVAIKLLAKSIETGHKPFIHLTFLDAYTPKQDQFTYGSSADFAEHYVDKTTGGLSFTDDDLTYAFNFDITDWIGADKGNSFPPGHQWPLIWYTRDIQVFQSNYGYKLSLEGGNGELSNLVNRFRRGGSCKLNNAQAQCGTP